MRGHHFRGEIVGHSYRHGVDIEKAIINTLDGYDGESDDVIMKIYVVSNGCLKNNNEKELMSVFVRWDEPNEAWQILKYI